MFKNPFSFDGRIGRAEYGISFIAYVIVAMFINGIVESGGDDVAMLALVYIPMLWFLFAQGAKRCHDIGNNGWWQLIPFYVFWLLFAEGNVGGQQYQLDTKNDSKHQN